MLLVKLKLKKVADTFIYLTTIIGVSYIAKS